MKQIFCVKGLHCKSCEILIEEKLNGKKGIKKAEVVLTENKLKIESKKKISLEKLNKWFEGSEYSFLEKFDKEKESKWWILGVIGIAGLFVLLSKIGWSQLININNQASWLIIFLFGIVAGFSSCGALLSGIVIGFEKEKYKIFLGRTISYIILGGILGYVGEKLVLGGWVNWLLIVVSAIMMITALEMLGVKWVTKLKTNWSKNLGKKIAEDKVAWTVGLLSVFLPCGFTMLAEGSAVMSGNWIKGVGIMLTFVVGSNISLWLISKGVGRIKNQKAVGLLVLFFVFYNLWFLMVPGIDSLTKKTDEKIVASEEKAKTVKLTYSAFGLTPSEINIKKGEKVRLEIEVKENQYGCMSTILLSGLFDKAQTLTKGKTLVMEFIPEKTGVYQFVCAMGVPHNAQVVVTE
jgi:sulfite exporter TauE/SafE/copper chaperone CopZ